MDFFFTRPFRDLTGRPFPNSAFYGDGVSRDCSSSEGSLRSGSVWEARPTARRLRVYVTEDTPQIRSSVLLEVGGEKVTFRVFGGEFNAL